MTLQLSGYVVNTRRWGIQLCNRLYLIDSLGKFCMNLSVGSHNLVIASSKHFLLFNKSILHVSYQLYDILPIALDPFPALYR